MIKTSAEEAAEARKTRAVIPMKGKEATEMYSNFEDEPKQQEEFVAVNILFEISI